MTSTFTEDLLGMLEIVWLLVLAVFLILTIPVWVLPYTAYRIWKQLKKNA
jgi:hypothetical protein